MADVTRAVDVPVGRKPTTHDISYLLKEGKLEEFFSLKTQREKDWKEQRYRICFKCNKKKLRISFKGDSKYCHVCVRVRKTGAPRRRKEYVQEYLSTERGLMYKHAKQVVYHLKKMGLLVPKPCETCFAEPVHAHHPDYTKPWEVMWLCQKHHVQWHKENEPKYV